MIQLLFYLILVNLSLLKLCFALLLEGDDDEGDEDVDEEEGEDDEVDDVEDGHLNTIEGDRSLVFVCDCHRLLEHDRPTLETVSVMTMIITMTMMMITSVVWTANNVRRAVGTLS